MVGAGAQEGRAGGQGPVAGGQLAQLALDFQLGQRGGQFQGRVTVGVGDVGEQVVNAAEADGGQQLVLLGGSVGNVVGLEVSYHSGLLRSIELIVPSKRLGWVGGNGLNAPVGFFFQCGQTYSNPKRLAP